MSDRTPARARPWQTLGAITARILARVTRTLGISLPDATAPIHSTGDRTMTHDDTSTAPRGHQTPDTTADTYGGLLPPGTRRDDDATAIRHLRFNVAEWRRAATRAKREGRGIAEVAGALVRAYGAGHLDAPEPVRPCDAWDSCPNPAHHHQPTPTHRDDS